MGEYWLNFVLVSVILEMSGDWKKIYKGVNNKSNTNVITACSNFWKYIMFMINNVSIVHHILGYLKKTYC